MKRLSGKITQLTGHRDELAALLSEAPVVPPVMVLDELTDHIGDILRSASSAHRKALIEALVAEVSDPRTFAEFAYDYVTGAPAWR